jgi:SAM-dependent methyltransferase
MKETTKSIHRRLHDVRFANTYFRGSGIDIGSGQDSLGKYVQQFPMISSLMSWDLENGDATTLTSLSDEIFDFVHSSHCLEHLTDPQLALQNWIRVCKPGGHILVTIPDEDLYEQGKYPSIFTDAHITSWTISKNQSWSPVSWNVFDLLNAFRSQIEILKVELINSMYIYDSTLLDQTLHNDSECAIEFIIRKRPLREIIRKGRYPE